VLKNPAQIADGKLQVKVRSGVTYDLTAIHQGTVKHHVEEEHTGDKGGAHGLVDVVVAHVVAMDGSGFQCKWKETSRWLSGSTPRPAALRP
jgi:hypothetical protein